MIPCNELSHEEREQITTALAAIAEPLLEPTADRSALSIPEVRRVLHELLDVSV